MRLKRFTSIIALLLLGVFLGIKALDYHPLTHAQDDDRVKCELCTLSLLNESTSYDQVSNSIDLPVLWISPQTETSLAQFFAPKEDRVYPTLFGRPPPSRS